MINSLTSTQPVKTPFDSLVYAPDKDGFTSKGPDIPSLLRVPDKDGFTAKTPIPDGARTYKDGTDKKEPTQWGKVTGLLVGSAALMALYYKGGDIINAIKNVFKK